MAGKGYLPRERILQWIDMGLTNTQIMELLAAEPYKLHPSSGAVRVIRARERPETRVLRDHSDMIPWTVRGKDQYKHVASMLRLESDVRAGITLEGRNLRYWESFRRKIEDPPQVITYVQDDPTGQGWYYLPREPWDTDIIRVQALSKRSTT